MSQRLRTWPLLDCCRRWRKGRGHQVLKVAAAVAAVTSTVVFAWDAYQMIPRLGEMFESMWVY